MKAFSDLHTPCIHSCACTRAVVATQKGCGLYDLSWSIFICISKPQKFDVTSDIANALLFWNGIKQHVARYCSTEMFDIRINLRWPDDTGPWGGIHSLRCGWYAIFKRKCSEIKTSNLCFGQCILMERGARFPKSETRMPNAPICGLCIGCCAGCSIRVMIDLYWFCVGHCYLQQGAEGCLQKRGVCTIHTHAHKAFHIHKVRRDEDYSRPC